MRIASILLFVALLPPAAHARTLGEIAFTSCTLEGSNRKSQHIEAECARYEVPENPAAPGGRKISLALALVPATEGKAEPDPVVLLAGGPGQSALEVYGDVAAAFEPMRRHRNVLLVDQRGTGKSNPLKCPLPDWKDPANNTVEAVRAQAKSCLAELSTRADPRFYTTSDAVRDLEAVRHALGSPQFNIVGGSYGTRVALEYLRRHPEGTRTVVIDSVVPPELALGRDHAVNLDDALTRIFAACNKDAACSQRFGDPAATLALLRERSRATRVKVTLHHPRTNAQVEDWFSKDLLAAVVRLYAYQPEAASLLPLLVDEAAHDRPEALVAQGELLFAQLSDAFSHGMELSVLCAEDVPWLEPRPEDERTLMGAEFVTLARSQCSVWPRGDMPKDFKQPVVSDKPVLLISGELDPVTPPRYAEQVAKTLSHARHFILKGQGHTPMGRGCMPRLVAQFVADANASALKPECLAALGPLPFFTSDLGPEP